MATESQKAAITTNALGAAVLVHRQYFLLCFKRDSVIPYGIILHSSLKVVHLGLDYNYLMCYLKDILMK